MIQLPQVTVVGTLTADPELRFTQSGKAVISFNIASNSRRFNKQTGEYEDGDTTFLRGQIWNEYAENIAESLSRGDRVIATGVLKQRSYETREGDKRTVYELEAEEVGPSLRFATAKVTKNNQRSSGRQAPAEDSSSGYFGNSGGGDADPWGGATPSLPGW
ncbi:ssDNA binding protein [Mycobacterium phage Kumao]|uniref:SsDNA binding protein n=1 Tax=Mycobacterium phage Kumao TaxID=2041344 RepID=A0A2D1GPQ1_9CAUD|nr:ssDNA binding protein [Mycobacterium phage Kumao]ATN94026.1 ssDNA binding protein [Mycobacterium phage Kumao]